MMASTALPVVVHSLHFLNEEFHICKLTMAVVKAEMASQVIKPFSWVPYPYKYDNRRKQRPAMVVFISGYLAKNFTYFIAIDLALHV
jgi:hypothetical protein